MAGLADEFNAALFVYDEGLLGSDMQLANALWRRFFLSMTEVSRKESNDVLKLWVEIRAVAR